MRRIFGLVAALLLVCAGMSYAGWNGQYFSFYVRNGGTPPGTEGWMMVPPPAGVSVPGTNAWGQIYKAINPGLEPLAPSASLGWDPRGLSPEHEPGTPYPPSPWTTYSSLIVEFTLYGYWVNPDGTNGHRWDMFQVQSEDYYTATGFYPLGGNWNSASDYSMEVYLDPNLDGENVQAQLYVKTDNYHSAPNIWQQWSMDWTPLSGGWNTLSADRANLWKADWDHSQGALPSDGNVVEVGVGVGSSKVYPPATSGDDVTADPLTGYVLVEWVTPSDTPIPVELSSVSAAEEDGKVVLNWVTATETENLGFNILRADSPTGEFVKVNAELIRAAGSTHTPNSYSFVDEHIVSGQPYFYRIEQVDFDGTTKVYGPYGVNGATTAVKPSTWSSIKAFFKNLVK